MAYEGQPAGNGENETTSQKGGRGPFRASGLGMAAVVILAVALSIAGVIAAERLPEREAAPNAPTNGEGTVAPVVLDATAGASDAGPASSISASPKTIGSAWSMAPLPEPPAYGAQRDGTGGVASASEITPLRATSSVVYQPH